jgi:hypothetical protein
LRPAADLRRCRELLGVQPGSSQEELKQAYHDLVKVWHPDRFPNDAGLRSRAETRLKEINEAYEALKDVSPSRSSSFSTGVQTVRTPRADRDAFRPFAWIVLVLFALALLTFTFYLYGRPNQPPDSTFQHLA